MATSVSDSLPKRLHISGESVCISPHDPFQISAVYIYHLLLRMYHIAKKKKKVEWVMDSFCIYI